MVLETLTSTSTELGNELAALAARVVPSVVELQSGHGGGAGVIWAPDGVIVTNHHVVPGEQARVRLADGRTFTGTVERRDPAQDLAVVRVPAGGLPAAAIGDSTALRVGQLVIAIGNPHGVPRAVTVGIVSGPANGRHGRLHWRDAIQSGIELRPGNSGGPLLDAAGRVVGINSMVIGLRLALSVPSQAVIELLTERGPAPYLGVTVQAAPLPAGLRAAGLEQPDALLVAGVADGGPADAAGLLPGDLLLALEWQPAAGAAGPRTTALIEPGDLAWSLARARGDAPVTLTVGRAGRVIRLTVVPGTRPA